MLECLNLHTYCFIHSLQGFLFFSATHPSFFLCNSLCYTFYVFHWKLSLYDTSRQTKKKNDAENKSEKKWRIFCDNVLLNQQKTRTGIGNETQKQKNSKFVQFVSLSVPKAWKVFVLTSKFQISQVSKSTSCFFLLLAMLAVVMQNTLGKLVFQRCFLDSRKLLEKLTFRSFSEQCLLECHSNNFFSQALIDLRLLVMFNQIPDKLHQYHSTFSDKVSRLDWLFNENVDVKKIF